MRQVYWLLKQFFFPKLIEWLEGNFFSDTDRLAAGSTISCLSTAKGNLGFGLQCGEFTGEDVEGGSPLVVDDVGHYLDVVVLVTVLLGAHFEPHGQAQGEGVDARVDHVAVLAVFI